MEASANPPPNLGAFSNWTRVLSFFYIFCEFSHFLQIYTLTICCLTVEFQLQLGMFLTLQSKNAFALSFSLCQIMYVVCTTLSKEGQFFDNDVFVTTM